MAKVYIEKEVVKHAYIYNRTGRDLKRDEFVAIGEIVGIVNRNAKQGEEVSIHIERFIEIQTNDFEPGDYLAGNLVYFDPGLDRFFDEPGDGRKTVGMVANNCIAEKGYFTFLLDPFAGAGAIVPTSAIDDTQAGTTKTFSSSKIMGELGIPNAMLQARLNGG